MIIVKDKRGFLYSFGFDPDARMPEPKSIFWTNSSDWAPSAENMAGSVHLDFEVSPEFVRELSDRIIAYQSGVCIEIIPVGLPMVMQVTTLLPSSNMITEIDKEQGETSGC